MSGISNDALLIANAIKEAGNTVAAAIDRMTLKIVSESINNIDNDEEKIPPPYFS